MKTFYISLVMILILPLICICDELDFGYILKLKAKATLAEDGKLNFTEIAKKYGYNPEQYDVVTDDGYILTIFRLPGEKPPVLFLHGLGDTADSCLARGSNSLGITLADAGYDVWVGNTRGNKYARRHIKLDADANPQLFWDFSFHEMAYYDLPKTIDLISEKTGEHQISTISHSQGTTIHYALGSLRPEYNGRIKVSIGLAPAAFMDNIGGLAKLLAPLGPAFDSFVPPSIQELPKNNAIILDVLRIICSQGKLSYAVCAMGLLFPLFGFDPKRFEPEFLNVFIGHFPGSFARKNLMHLDQIILRGKFSRYDYGMVKNLVKYCTASPPDYDLSAVTMKVALIVAKNDNLCNIKDVERLRNRLPNVVHHEILGPERWNHIDFLTSKDSHKYLYPTIFKLLKKYN